MEIVIYLLAGAALGGLIGWLIAQNKKNRATEQLQAELRNEKQQLENQWVQYQATATAQLQSTNDALAIQKEECRELKLQRETLLADLDNLRQQQATVKASYDAARLSLIEKNNDLLRSRSAESQTQEQLQKTQEELARFRAQYQSLDEKLRTQKEDMIALNQKFNTEFENIANRILETKTGHFTELNKTNLKNILEPLGENIREFKKQVQESYGNESKERYALQNEVKQLLLLNQQLSREAQQLTRALKSESKTQGRWGEMILEKILDKSGLRKNEEFFMEHQLFAPDGRPLVNAVTGKKMRPDALIVYPDNRHLIIDAKVSLTAFIRYADADEESLQEAELAAHVRSVKNHINELQVRAYEDYDKSMDFVMMFIPNEAAYFAALKGDPQLWEYAYERRILLISPTNLIAALKLMADIWKRERNDRNSMEIANRALKMYEKLVGFVDNLDGVGKHLGHAREKYEDAVKQLQTGRDNFFAQAGKMKDLLHYNKTKDFPQAYLDEGADNATRDPIGYQGSVPQSAPGEKPETDSGYDDLPPEP